VEEVAAALAQRTVVTVHLMTPSCQAKRSLHGDAASRK